MTIILLYVSSLFVSSLKETRPYNQGSRLTAFEILEEGMPGGQLICDSAAGALMQVS